MVLETVPTMTAGREGRSALPRYCATTRSVCRVERSPDGQRERGWDVELTEEESSALQQALHTYVSDLRSEISHTDDRDFRA